MIRFGFALLAVSGPPSHLHPICHANRPVPGAASAMLAHRRLDRMGAKLTSAQRNDRHACPRSQTDTSRLPRAGRCVSVLSCRPHPSRPGRTLRRHHRRAVPGRRRARRRRDRLAGPLVLLLWPRLNRLARRFAGLAARVAAGTAAPRRPASPRPAAARPRPPYRRLPRRFAWLLPLVPEAAAASGRSCSTCWPTPEMAACSPPRRRPGRLLRPLCRMLGVRPPPAPAPAAAAAAPRPAAEPPPPPRRRRATPGRAAPAAPAARLGRRRASPARLRPARRGVSARRIRLRLDVPYKQQNAATAPTRPPTAPAPARPSPTRSPRRRWRSGTGAVASRRYRRSAA